MHKIFGKKEDACYTDREGVYLIPLRGATVGVIETPKGYFLLGGGLDEGESHEDGLRRECFEETGCAASVGACIGSAEAYTVHPTVGYFHPIQTYYLGTLSDPVVSPVESDHRLVWMKIDIAIHQMYSEMQRWAIQMAINGKNSDKSQG